MLFVSLLMNRGISCINVEFMQLTGIRILLILMEQCFILLITSISTCKSLKKPMDISHGSSI